MYTLNEEEGEAERAGKAGGLLSVPCAAASAESERQGEAAATVVREGAELAPKEKKDGGGDVAAEVTRLSFPDQEYCFAPKAFHGA